ncbi:hypothetical protein Q3G72_020919 [Acer saccharum]|nr:hypothetical protein Q3G72_020919 [Acer saccharum]
MQGENSNFFYTIDLDEDGRLKNVLWVDARSRNAYKEFGDVITFDSTYLTNKYDMPFATFVGLNHHGQSILLGCGLVSNEDTKTYIWLFQSWLACMLGCPPKSIITDQDKAMKNAIEVVFPSTWHRWCLWHIMKKLPEKLRGYKEYEQIKFTLKNIVYNSITPEEFEERWTMFLKNFHVSNNEWLNGLYVERQRWVPAFVKNSFWAGMLTTQRSESMHALFDGYVNSKTSLKQFVEQYENALRDKVEKEKHADFNSLNTQIPCVTHYAIEKQFQAVYTNAKFREFQQEVTDAIGNGELNSNILTTRVVRSKGRPPYKRRQSKVEQIIRKKKKGKQREMKLANDNNCLKDQKVVESAEVATINIESSTSLDSHIFGTQESTALEDNRDLLGPTRR